MTGKTISSYQKEIVLHNLEHEAFGDYSVMEGSSLTLVVYAAPKKHITSEISVRLKGKGSNARIIGVFINNKSNHISLKTLQHHQAADTSSNLLIKSVLNDESTFSFDGAIRVEKEGQKTDAYQRNENLMISDNAFAQSKPSLEILANDVRCTHGATIGHVNPDQLFYMKSRGIDEHQGIELIVNGFLLDAIAKIEHETYEKKIMESLWQNG